MGQVHELFENMDFALQVVVPDFKDVAGRHLHSLAGHWDFQSLGQVLHELLDRVSLEAEREALLFVELLLLKTHVHWNGVAPIAHPSEGI